MTSPNTRACPACGTVMPASFPEGLCPKCMLAAQVASVEVLDRTLPVAAPVSGAQPERAGGVPTLEALRGLFPELEILDVLGAGGMGAVYKARQPRLNRLVALKIMVAAPGHEADFALRFEREAQVLARLNHPHIVILHDFGELGAERTGADPLFYFLMEHVDGTDLGQIIKSKELTPAQALAIVPQICEALQYAHDQGITHRDIKPANILIDKRGGVKIADFGLAKVVGGAEEAMMTGLTQTGTAMGTPHYMAPEQWEHPDQVDHRADIYALGVVFYEMLTGERPAGVFEPPSKKTSPPVDRKLDKVVLRAMEKNPERRYQQAGQIRDDVTRISGAHKRRPASGNDGTEAGRPRLKLLLAFGAVAALAAGGWWLWLPPQGGGEGLRQDRADSPPPAAATAQAALAGPGAPRTAEASAARPWVSAFPDPTKLPGLVESRDGWVLSDQLTVPVRTASGGEMRLLNAGLRARMRFSEGAGPEAAQLILRRGSRGGDHFELRYYRNLSGDRPNQFQIRHWDHKLKRSTMLAGVEVAEDVHDAPEGFVLEFYAIGSRLHGRLNGAYPVNADVPDAAFVQPGEAGFAKLKDCWLTDMEILHLDGLPEAETLGGAGTFSNASQDWQDLLSESSALHLMGGAAVTHGKLVLPARAGGAIAAASNQESKRKDGTIRMSVTFRHGKPQPSLIARQSPQNARYSALVRQGDRVLLQRVSEDNEEIEVSSYPLPAPLRDGETYELELRAVGTRLSVWLKGVELGGIEDASVSLGWFGVRQFGDAEVTVEALAFRPFPSSVADSPAHATPGRLEGKGTLFGGKALDLARCGAFDDFVDVAGGPDSWVALRAGGQTISSDGQADFTGIRKIARSYGGYHCFIDEAGGLRFHPAREMTLPASLKGRVIVDAACGSHQGLALLEDGQAVVFGKRYEEAMEDTTQAQGTGTPRWPQPDPAALRDVKGVAVTQTHAATLHHDGTVSVWGWQGPVTWQPEPELKPVRQLSSFHDALHLLDEAGQVWTFSLPRSVHPDQPVGFNGRVRRQAGQVARLRDHLWLRQDGTWSGIEADRPTMEMLGSASLRPETNFTLLASIAGAKPYGYVLWIQPVEAE